MIITYIFIGWIWALLNEKHIINNSHRLRMVFFWPITLTTFIVGFIEAIIDKNN